MQPTLNVHGNARAEFFRETGRSGRGRWLSVEQSPFSRAYTYRLINEGLVASVAVTLPGSRRSRRLIDGDSLDRFLETLMSEQQAAKQQDSNV
jgi:hypothetical protein